MNDWIDNLCALSRDGVPSVLVTVAKVRGSAPRETGAKMIVSAAEAIGTIGGGQLEYQCIKIACEALQAPSGSSKTVRKFALGAGCGQCCGGVVEMLFERVAASSWMPTLQRLQASGRPFVIGTAMSADGGKFFITKADVVETQERSLLPPAALQRARVMLADGSPAESCAGLLLEPVRRSDFHIAVFGAGHVGAATVDVLSRLECNIRWVDSRSNLWPSALPSGVAAIETDNPADEVAEMPPGTHYLVMTYSHPLDLQICEQVLSRGDHVYLGLIGSASKRRKFERLLKRGGYSAGALQSLVCPIGLPGMNGKKPAEIALAVAAELLLLRQVTQAGTVRVENLQVRG